MELSELVQAVLLWSTAIVGGASMIVKGLAMIFKVTPGRGDDKMASAALQWIAKVQKLLDAVALNPTADQARPPKPKPPA